MDRHREAIYNRDVNGIYYINANLPAAQSAFTGADTRLRWIANNRVNATRMAPVTSERGRAEEPERGHVVEPGGSVRSVREHGLWMKTAYSYGEAKNTVDPGSIALGSWNNNQHSDDPNNPGLGYAIGSPGHRFFASAPTRRD